MKYDDRRCCREGLVVPLTTATPTSTRHSHDAPVTAPAILATDPADLDRPVPAESRAALAAAVLGFFIVTFDAVVVDVALPSIRADLGGGISGLQWVVDGYTLMFAALLLAAGAFSDRARRRRAFTVGVVVFVAASAACGLAPGLGTLVAARFAQGSAAAVMMPASMALIGQTYPDPTRRARAVAIWAMGGAIASSSGPVLGGLLTLVSWRLIFLINIPVGLVAVALAARIEPLAAPGRSLRRCRLRHRRGGDGRLHVRGDRGRRARLHRPGRARCVRRRRRCVAPRSLPGNGGRGIRWCRSSCSGDATSRSGGRRVRVRRRLLRAAVRDEPVPPAAARPVGVPDRAGVPADDGQRRRADPVQRPHRRASRRPPRRRRRTRPDGGRA